MIVKICGLTNKDDALWAVNLGADMLGFIFVKESSRKVSIKRAQEITAEIPSFVKKVGVFLNEEQKVVEKVAQTCNLNVLQFHGDESPEYCDYFSQKYKVIKTCRVKDEESISGLRSFSVDYVLLDTFIEGLPGGTGTIFNWDVALKVKELGAPVILSGGLNVENVGDAIKKVSPYAVDVASGIEIRPGKKDYELMKNFIAKAKK